MTKRTPRTKDVLRYARNILINKGWCQDAPARNIRGTKIWVLENYFNSELVNFCATGALGKAKIDLKASIQVRTKAENKLIQGLQTIKYEYASSVEQYNDHIGRSKDDIINLYNLALKE